MPRYIAFRTNYVDRILTEDEQECTLDIIIPEHRVCLVTDRHGREYFFATNHQEHDDLDNIIEEVPPGSIVFARLDGKNVGFEDMMLYSSLRWANFCKIEDFEEIKEFENVVVVECCTESG